MDLHGRYAKERDLATRNIAGETVIVPIKNSVVNLARIFTLNEVASRIWSLIDGTASARQIAEVIAAEFEVSFDDAVQDVSCFLAELKEKGLIL